MPPGLPAAYWGACARLIGYVTATGFNSPMRPSRAAALTIFLDHLDGDLRRIFALVDDLDALEARAGPYSAATGVNS